MVLIDGRRITKTTLTLVSYISQFAS